MSRPLIVAAKLAVSAILLTLLVSRTDLSEVWAAVRGADWLTLSAAFAMFYVGYSIVASRWRILLSALGAEVPFGYLFRSFMVAVFFNNFLPSTVGGDAMRMYDSWRTGVSKTSAVTVVMVDRFMGLLALLLFALCGLLLGAQRSFGESQIGWVVGLASAAACAVLLLLLFLPQAAAGLGSKLSSGAPAKLADLFGRIVASLRGFAARRDALWMALLLSIALQANVIVYHWLVATAFGLDVSLIAFFLIVPVALIVMMIPISINGIGVRESVFVLLLGTQGVSEAEGLAYAWLVYSFLLVQGLIGGVVFALRRERQREDPA